MFFLNLFMQYMSQVNYSYNRLFIRFCSLEQHSRILYILVKWSWPIMKITTSKMINSQWNNSQWTGWKIGWYLRMTAELISMATPNVVKWTLIWQSGKLYWFGFDKFGCVYFRAILFLDQFKIPLSTFDSCLKNSKKNAFFKLGKNVSVRRTFTE